MLLSSFQTIISNPYIIVAVVLASLGVACSLSAKMITKCVRKVEKVDPSDKLLLGLKIAGLTLVLLAFVVLFFYGAKAVEF